MNIVYHGGKHTSFKMPKVRNESQMYRIMSFLYYSNVLHVEIEVKYFLTILAYLFTFTPYWKSVCVWCVGHSSVGCC